MCPPDLYDVHYVINPWMEGNLHRSSRERAAQQWQNLFSTLEPLAHVLLIDPVAGSPDMVFTANAGLARNGICAVSRFLHPERQGEEEHFRQWFRRAGYTVVDLPSDTPFEGEGDALFSADGTRLFIGYGTRTSLASHPWLSSLWPSEIVSLRLTNPRFYHLDTCFAPLSNGDLLYYPAAFDSPSLAAIESVYTPSHRIAVSEGDALRFACNAVNLGEHLVLNRISDGLAQQLASRGFHVAQVELDEFLKAGGAAKCLTMLLTPELHGSVRTRPEQEAHSV